MLRPHPLPHYIGGQEAPWGAIRGGGVPLGLLLPKGDLPTGESYAKEDCKPTWSRISPLWRPPHLQADLGSLGGLPPRLGAWGSGWYCPETSGTFQKLPGPSDIISGHSGTFWSTSRTFRDHSRTFLSHPDSFQDHPSYSLSHPMNAKVVGRYRDIHRLTRNCSG